MANRPTLKDIAKKAGLSQVAVSKALRNASDISDATKEKVRRIAEELGYTPNVAARNLSSQRSTAIGMVVPEIGRDTAYDTAFNEISRAAAERDYCVMLGSSRRSVELEVKHCRIMTGNQAGAMIVASATDETAHIKAACGAVPVIFIGGKTSPEEKYSLLCDYRYSGTLAVSYLADKLGHKNIVLLTYEPENRTIRQKEEGFRAAMEARGLTPRVLRTGHASDTMRAGMEAVKILLELGNFPTAIWCASDQMALGVMYELKLRGIAVPDNVSVMGHDGLYPDHYTDIRLTTLRLPMKKLGEEAVKLAVSLMEHDSQFEPRQIFKAELIRGDSTGPFCSS